MTAFRGMMAEESLDHFHQRCVVPTQEETEGRNAEIDGFVRFLHRPFGTAPYTVAKVVKSGSLGKGTAVRGSADIDLVVIVNGLPSISELKKQRTNLLDRLEQEVDNYQPWKGRVRREDRTSYSLCYTLNGQEVDVLPALDIDSVYGSSQEVYRQMSCYTEGKKRAAQEFSASLAPLQIEFVKTEGEAVKRVIRLLKFWKKEKNLDTLRSYTLELLTIYQSRTVHWRGTDDLFREVLSLLVSCSSIKVAFDNNYNSASYVKGLDAPYVLDPANPYMNTMYRVDANEVSRAAREMLRRL